MQDFVQVPAEIVGAVVLDSQWQGLMDTDLIAQWQLARINGERIRTIQVPLAVPKIEPISRRLSPMLKPRGRDLNAVDIHEDIDVP
jgi:hypothetical protein